MSKKAIRHFPEFVEALEAIVASGIPIERFMQNMFWIDRADEEKWDSIVQNTEGKNKTTQNDVLRLVGPLNLSRKEV